MKAISQHNKYYCHKRLREIGILVKDKAVHLPYDMEVNRYAKRLRDIYNYSIQTYIR